MTCGLATALEPPHFNHAPVRGATGASFSRRSRAGSFNPRTRVGCDISAALSLRPLKMFQSTHPRGVRLFPKNGNVTVFLFQSTHPRGVRHLGRVELEAPENVSIHAPAWGATKKKRPFPALSRRFQSTHPRGVRREALRERDWGQLVSIHAPAWGATPRLWTTMGSCTCFNPRTRVGCDPGPRSS